MIHLDEYHHFTGLGRSLSVKNIFDNVLAKGIDSFTVKDVQLLLRHDRHAFVFCHETFTFGGEF